MIASVKITDSIHLQSQGSASGHIGQSGATPEKSRANADQSISGSDEVGTGRLTPERRRFDASIADGDGFTDWKDSRREGLMVVAIVQIVLMAALVIGTGVILKLAF